LVTGNNVGLQKCELKDSVNWYRYSIMFFQQLRLLLWKNFILRKRHWVSFGQCWDRSEFVSLFGSISRMQWRSQNFSIEGGMARVSSRRRQWSLKVKSAGWFLPLFN